MESFILTKKPFKTHMEEPCQKFFDEGNNRLVYVNIPANETYWDIHWANEHHGDLYGKLPRYNMVVRETRRYLAPGSLVLEGGCGLARASWYLHLAGYKTLALDYAKKTVCFVNSKVPIVRPLLGDVRSLPLLDCTIDGYWSLGVIEHFYEGYEEIREEMHRVIRPQGYLFLTFPHMSKLRRLKAALRFYPAWQQSQPLMERFYQFALDENRVMKDFVRNGFELVHRGKFLGITGLQDESSRKAHFLLTPLKGRSLLARCLGAAFESWLRHFTSHSVLLVLRRC